MSPKHGRDAYRRVEQTNVETTEKSRGNGGVKGQTRGRKQRKQAFCLGLEENSVSEGT